MRYTDLKDLLQDIFAPQQHKVVQFIKEQVIEDLVSMTLNLVKYEGNHQEIIDKIVSVMEKQQQQPEIKPEEVKQEVKNEVSNS